MAGFLLFAVSYLYSEQYKCVYYDWLRGEQCEDNISQGQCSYLEGKYTPGKCAPSKKPAVENNSKYTRSQADCMEKCTPKCKSYYHDYERKSCIQSCKAQCWIYE